MLLSGIGPATQLKQHSIPVAKDLPGVGAHLVDHPVVDVYFKSKANSPNYLKPRNPIHLIKYLGAAVQYLATRRGPLANNVRQMLSDLGIGLFKMNYSSSEKRQPLSALTTPRSSLRQTSLSQSQTVPLETMLPISKSSPPLSLTR